MGISSSKPMYRGMAEKMREPMDSMNMSFGSKSKNMPMNCKLGEKVTLTVTGEITSLREDEYGKSLGMEITGVEKYAKEKKEA